MPRTKRSKRVTPARVKDATRAALRDPEMLRRIRRIESQNRASAVHDSKTVPYRSMAVAAPLAVGRVSSAPGLRDMTIDFNAQVATLLVGNGVLGTTDAIYFGWSQTGVSSPTLSIAREYPIALGNWTVVTPGTNEGGYGVSYLNDIMRHFRYKSFDKLSVHVEPIGYGANTNSSISYALAPLAGGNEDWASQSSTTTLTPYGAGSVRSMKGGIETPAYQALDIDLMPYVMTPGMDRRRPSEALFLIDNGGSMQLPNQAHVNAQKVPCGLLVGGSSIGVTAARGTAIALVTVSGRMRLSDFLGAFFENGGGSALSDGRPPRLPGDEKQPAPRFVLADKGQIASPSSDPSGLATTSESKDPDWVDPLALPTASYLRAGGQLHEWKTLSREERSIWLSDTVPRNVKRATEPPPLKRAT